MKKFVYSLYIFVEVMLKITKSSILHMAGTVSISFV